MTKVIVSSMNHEGAFGDETSHFAGYYLVNDKKFNDDGNTDRGDQAKLPMADYVLELLGIDPEESVDGWSIICDGMDQFDYEPQLWEISGSNLDNLTFKRLDNIPKTVVTKIGDLKVGDEFLGLEFDQDTQHLNRQMVTTSHLELGEKPFVCLGGPDKGTTGYYEQNEFHKEVEVFLPDKE